MAHDRRERELLREQVDGARHLRALEDIAARFAVGKEHQVDVHSGMVHEVPLDALRISALDKAASIHTTLLRKVLPDPRPVEISGPDGEPLQMTVQSDRLALATKVLALAREAEEQAPAAADEATLEELLS